LILQLDDDDPVVRGQASLRVNSLDGSALGVVEAALRSEATGPEAANRLKIALQYIRPRAVREREQTARAAWESKTLHEAYQKFGRTNPAYDAQALRAIDLFLRLGRDPLRGPAAPRTAALAAFDSAVDKGCDDPHILCLRLCADGRTGGLMGPESYRTATGVANGPYTPAAKMLAVVAYLGSTDHADDTQRSLPSRLLPEVLNDPDLPATEADALVDAPFDALQRGIDLKGDLPALVRAYKTARPGAPGPMILEAKTLIMRALDPGDRTVFGPNGREDTAAAGKLLEQAAQLAPDDPRPPTLMLVVLTNLAGDPGQFEQWFQRAVTADPDNYAACRRKLDYLSPGRHGSSEELLRFGRWCLATQNWRGSIPFLLGSAHEMLAGLSADPDAYFQNPEVWQDVRAVYDGAVLNASDPASLASFRSGYAKWAAQCGKWKVARELFDLLGDKPDLAAFGSRETYDYYRRKAVRRASETPGQSETGPATHPAGG